MSGRGYKVGCSYLLGFSGRCLCYMIANLRYKPGTDEPTHLPEVVLHESYRAREILKALGVSVDDDDMDPFTDGKGCDDA